MGSACALGVGLRWLCDDGVPVHLGPPPPGGEGGGSAADAATADLVGMVRFLARWALLGAHRDEKQEPCRGGVVAEHDAAGGR